MVGVLLQRVFSYIPGEDGPSQMALEDLAMFRSVPMSTVFYPSDGVSTEKAVELAANTKVGHMLFCFLLSGGVGGGRLGGCGRPACGQSWSFTAPEWCLLTFPWCL